jgi:microcystin-dependent protein
MSDITPINANDIVRDSRAVINTNFENLNTDKVETLGDLGITITDTQINALPGQIAAINTAPAGSIFMYPAAAAPTGFLLCDGSAVSRTTYAGLFAVTSTTYGAGDGSTTFNLPDLRSRFPLGYSASAPTKVFTFASRSSNVITVTGADNHAHNELQTGQAVLYSAPSGAMTGLTHNTTYYVVRVTATTFSLATSVANANAGTVISLSSDGTGAQTFTATYTVRPMAQSGGEETHALSDAEMPSHKHELVSYSGSLGGSNTVLTTQSSRVDFNSIPETTVTGSDTPHNNMPLFTVVNFIIKH